MPESLEARAERQRLQLLEMGFRPDVTKILAALEATRQSRQTLLFSATLMSDILQAPRLHAPSRGRPCRDCLLQPALRVPGR